MKVFRSVIAGALLVTCMTVREANAGDAIASSDAGAQCVVTKKTLEGKISAARAAAANLKKAIASAVQDLSPKELQGQVGQLEEMVSGLQGMKCDTSALSDSERRRLEEAASSFVDELRRIVESMKAQLQETTTSAWRAKRAHTLESIVRDVMERRPVVAATDKLEFSENWHARMSLRVAELKEMVDADGKAGAAGVLSQDERTNWPQEISTAESVLGVFRDDIDTTRECRAAHTCESVYATDLCRLNEERGELQRALNRERANPSGVVDLARLHDIGRTMQANADEMAARRADYRIRTGKDFAASICK